jgi:hypothetical protein
MKYLADAYEKVTLRSFGYLLPDFRQDMSDNLRVISDMLLGEEGYYCVTNYVQSTHLKIPLSSRGLKSCQILNQDVEYLSSLFVEEIPPTSYSWHQAASDCSFSASYS